MDKLVAYFMKWVKFLPISQNGQFHGLDVTYIDTHIVPNLLYKGMITFTK